MAILLVRRFLKAQRELGWTPRDPQDTLTDTVEDLQADAASSELISDPENVSGRIAFVC